MPRKRKGRVSEGDRAFAMIMTEFRSMRRLTQQELAQKIGVSYQQIQKYEKAKNRISMGRAFQIAEALDVPLTTLIQLMYRPEMETADHQVARLLTTFRCIRDPAARTEVCRIAEFFARQSFQRRQAFQPTTQSP